MIIKWNEIIWFNYVLVCESSLGTIKLKNMLNLAQRSTKAQRPSPWTKQAQAHLRPWKLYKLEPYPSFLWRD